MKIREWFNEFMGFLYYMLFLISFIPILMILGILYMVDIAIEGVFTRKCPKCGWRNNRSRVKCRICNVVMVIH